MNEYFSDEVDLKISIIIPAYNVEEYIDDALNSVLSQAVLPYEIILVNDGSTDDTLAVAEQFKGEHPRYKVYTTNNQGLGPARNFGLAKATGDYVYFFDSDDVMASQFVEVIAKAVIEYQDPDMIVFSGESFSDKGQKLAFNPPNYKRKINAGFDNGPAMYRELEKTQSLFSSACLYVTKRSVWTDSGLRFKPIVHEDEEVLLPLFFAIKHCCALTDVLFYRRVREGSIMTGGVTRKNAAGMMQVLATLMALKKRKPKVVDENADLWQSRTQGMLVAAFARSIQSGMPIPNILMIKVLREVFSLRLVLRIAKQYVVAIIKPFRSKVSL